MLYNPSMTNCKHCGKEVKTRRNLFCNRSCYASYRKGKSFKDPQPKKRCSVHRCFKWAIAKGMCDRHYREVKKYGKVRKPCEKRASSGQGHLDKYGYVRVTHPTTKRQCHAHRIIMEEHLGRLLYPEETVHHINGVRHDNRLENLELWTKHHPAGQRVSDKIVWAKEILRLYGEVALALQGE